MVIRLRVRAAAASLAIGIAAASLGIGGAAAAASLGMAPPQLLDGVDSIASAGVPGPLALIGPDAFALVAGRLDRETRLPVVAGAAFGRGRVIAFGHGGMIGAAAMKHPGTARFVESALRWLAGEARTPAERVRVRVLVVDDEALAERLGTREEFLCTAAPRRDWTRRLDGVEVLVVDAHRIGDEERPLVADFVRRGGGLLTAGLGWGWLQLHPGATIHDHPGNRLLAECGIVWCDGTLEPSRDDAFAVEPLAPSLHAIAAMDALAAAAPVDAQVASTITAAVRAAPPGHALLARAAGIVERQADRAVPAQGRPLRRRDASARAILGLELELERRAAPETITAHPAARAFPGSVPDDAPRIERTVEIDLAVAGWHSTGLYAPAGEVIRVRSLEPAPGLRVRVGAHTDQLWHLDRWERAPDIARSWPMPKDGAVMQVASAFGGLIFVETGGRGTGTAHVEIGGAVEAPRFVLGRTSPEEWRRLRDAPAPWGELESSKVIVTVPGGVLRTLEDPAPVMAFWDRISDAHATLAEIPLQPERPHRFVADLQISAGYMHSGYPIMTHLDAAKTMVDAEALRRGAWGLLHELGHNHQRGEWTFDGTVEVTCNLFSLHAIDTICSPAAGDRGHDAVNAPPSVGKHLAAGAPFAEWKRDPFLALQMYIQLQRAFGWETFRRVFAEYRALPDRERPKSDDEKRDQWMVRFSRACGRDLGPFFQAWGVPTSEAARRSIADLPDWMPPDWPSPAP